MQLLNRPLNLHAQLLKSKLTLAKGPMPLRLRRVCRKSKAQLLNRLLLLLNRLLHLHHQLQNRPQHLQTQLLNRALLLLNRLLHLHHQLLNRPLRRTWRWCKRRWKKMMKCGNSGNARLRQRSCTKSKQTLAKGLRPLRLRRARRKLKQTLAKIPRPGTTAPIASQLWITRVEAAGTFAASVAKGCRRKQCLAGGRRLAYG